MLLGKPHNLISHEGIRLAQVCVPGIWFYEVYCLHMWRFHFALMAKRVRPAVLDQLQSLASCFRDATQAGHESGSPESNHAPYSPMRVTSFAHGSSVSRCGGGS